MDSWIQDIKYGVTVAVKRPVVTAVAVLSLALGIGANTAIFTVINAVFLHPLAIADPSSVVEMFTHDSRTVQGTASNLTPTSLQNYVDYRAGNVRKALRELTPDGVDVYFDNVGGEILDAVLTRLALGARVVICGAVSQYNEAEVRGPANYMMLLVARASMTGMLVFDYEDRYPLALADLAGWLQDGSLVSREHVVHGSVHDFPETLLMLFDGANTGKLVLALEPE